VGHGASRVQEHSGHSVCGVRARDAKNLQGGTLLVTPLLGADGKSMRVGPGLGRGRRFLLPRVLPPVLSAVCRRSAASPTAPSSNARSEFALNRLPMCASRCATPTSQPPARIAAAGQRFLGVKTEAEPIRSLHGAAGDPAEFKGNVVAFA